MKKRSFVPNYILTISVEQLGFFNKNNKKQSGWYDFNVMLDSDIIQTGNGH